MESDVIKYGKNIHLPDLILFTKQWKFFPIYFTVYEIFLYFQINNKVLEEWSTLSYKGIVKEVVSLFIPEEEIPKEKLSGMNLNCGKKFCATKCLKVLFELWQYIDLVNTFFIQIFLIIDNNGALIGFIRIPTHVAKLRGITGKTRVLYPNLGKFQVKLEFCHMGIPMLIQVWWTKHLAASQLKKRLNFRNWEGIWTFWSCSMDRLLPSKTWHCVVSDNSWNIS